MAGHHVKVAVGEVKPMGVADTVLGLSAFALSPVERSKDELDHRRVNVHADDLPPAAGGHLLGDDPRAAAHVQHSFGPQQVDPPVELSAHRPRPAGLAGELSVPFLDREV